jgi:hypothetical protein
LPALGLPAEHVISRHLFTSGNSVMAEFERAVKSSRYSAPNSVDGNDDAHW